VNLLERNGESGKEAGPAVCIPLALFSLPRCALRSPPVQIYAPATGPPVFLSRKEFPLTTPLHATTVPTHFTVSGENLMSRICSITQSKPLKGSVIHRRGLAKKKGGIGQHVTAVVSRTFYPNLRKRRLWVTELNKFVTVKLSARALKTVTKNGAFATLKKAGIV